ncbi:hypothetical protein VYA_42360 (plasmid) [Vibrio alfacsensis]|uniref:hypothetical protein n=1 Tax=Vibrio sp. 04Ya108 TaxID=864336 RepID=UPI00159ED705|nr:hypothetical protein [Vibrio sp. 04Ya108]BCN27044.1 hypothetical protein VYA_42360 [Vibrio alfacsensis]
MPIKIKNTPRYADVSKIVLIFILLPLTSIGYLAYNLSPSWFIGSFLCCLVLTFKNKRAE